MQLTKELIIPAIEQMKMCLRVLLEVLPSLQVNKNCIDDEKYKYIFSVEEVNRLVMKGIPFREAYHAVSESIRDNSFVPDTNVNHTHLGSIGNVH
jgi:argininosuccinate lyase